MSKRFTKIICTAVAAVSAATLVFLPACKKEWGGISGEKDTSAYAKSNGGFLTETEDYVYFINGKASATDSNSFGDVLKGSVQRLKKTDLAEGNYSKTDTVVPSVIYSGSYNAGLYIYGGYIYYTTPSSDKNADGEILNGNLEFKRTSLDGSSTSGNLWSTGSMSVDYRYVQPVEGGDVYILYAISENLYGTSATNIHSVNCTTGSNTILAYNVADYKFDTEDATNPYVYYTMSVPQYLGGTNYRYNQLYMVRADASSSPREYDLTDAGDTKYINYGKHVFDGIGKVNYEAERVNQFNYVYDVANKTYDKTLKVDNADRTFGLKWYKNGTLYFTSQTSDNNIRFYSLDANQLDTDSDGKVDDSWNAMTKLDDMTALVNGNVTTEYEFVNLSDGLYAINATSGGVTKSKLENGKLGDSIYVTEDSASKVLTVREEENLGHTYLYYSTTGGNGYTINRVAIDGTEDDYVKLSTSPETDLTYETVKVLNLDACSDWYKPEFVGEKLFFASETEGMSSYNYIMVCDLEGEDGIMSNEEIDKLNETFKAVTEKIESFDDEENADGTAAYSNLSSALKYLYNTGDVEYIDKLINAYVDIEGKDKEYVYSEASVQIYKDFATAEGKWEREDEEDETSFSYKENTKTINGKTVYANSREYYYSVVGRMTEGDANALKESFKKSYMQTYPTVETFTWWEKLSTGGKVGTVFGIVEGSMLVIGGGVILVYFLVSRKKTGSGGSSRAINVDLTDDKDIDVYGDGNGEKE